jgi:hypothetical protein
MKALILIALLPLAAMATGCSTTHGASHTSGRVITHYPDEPVRVEHTVTRPTVVVRETAPPVIHKKVVIHKHERPVINKRVIIHENHHDHRHDQYRDRPHRQVVKIKHKERHGHSERKVVIKKKGMNKTVIRDEHKRTRNKHVKVHEKTQVKHRPGKNQTVIKKQKNRTVIKNTPHGQKKIKVKKQTKIKTNTKSGKTVIKSKTRKTVVKDGNREHRQKPAKIKKQVTIKEHRVNKNKPKKEKAHRKTKKHEKNHKEARLDRRSF